MASSWDSGKKMPGGFSDDGPVSTKGVLTVAVIIFLVGLLFGYGIKTFASRSTQPSLSESKFRESSIIEPNVVAMRAGSRDQAGAVRAATSFVTGFGELSALRGNEVDQVLSNVVDESADSNLKLILKTTISSLRTQSADSANAGGQTKLVVTPIAYKVDMQNGGEKAKVTSWVNNVFVVTDAKEVVSSWSTHEITLIWKNDAWKIAAYDGSSGPTPQPVNASGEVSKYEDAIGVLNGSRSYRYATSD